MQIQLMKVFDNLIFNDDRNVGNILIDAEWRLWWIDHTRAFRTFSQLSDPESIRYCDRNLWNKLQTLDTGEVKTRLKEYLRDNEISALLKRRKVLVEHIEGLIEERGAGQVLFVLY
jgi:hypothetical protein